MEKTIIKTGTKPIHVAFVLSDKEIERYETEIEQLAEDLYPLSFSKYCKAGFIEELDALKQKRKKIVS